MNKHLSNSKVTTNRRAASDDGSLQRGLQILDVLVESARPTGLSEIADRLGIAASSAHRVLQVLVRQQYVSQDGSKRYVAAPKAFLPLSLYHPLNLLRRDAYDIVRHLSQRFGQTSSIVIFIGRERLVLEVSDSTQSLSPYYETHLTSPIHASATGKLLLLRFSESEKSELLGAEPFQGFTENTITSRADLERDLRLTTQLGYAVSLDETYSGMSAVAAPIPLGPDRVLGCFAVVGESAYFYDNVIKEIGEALTHAANLFSAGRPSAKMARAFFGI